VLSVDSSSYQDTIEAGVTSRGTGNELLKDRGGFRLSRSLTVSRGDERGEPVASRGGKKLCCRGEKQGRVFGGENSFTVQRES